MTAYARRSFAGGAVTTTLAAGIGSSDTTFTLSSGTNWPSGSGGNFFVVINRAATNEEKILCSATSGTTVTVATSGRGADGSSASTHSAGEIVSVCLAAQDADEANQAVVQVLGQSGAAAGDLSYVTGTAPTTLGRLGIGTAGKLLTSSGTAPQWQTAAASGILDATVGDIQPVANTAAVGNAGLAADGKHSHKLGVGTTTGDTLVYLSGTGWVRLPIGADGQRLTADSGQTNGLAWETPPASQLFTSSGTYTTANDGVTHTYRISGVGGGGGGGQGAGSVNNGGGGGAGGGGAYSVITASVAPNTALAVVTGAGGTGDTGSGATNGSASTVVSASFSARGGNAGGGTTSGAGGSGGQPGGCASLTNPVPGAGGAGGATTVNGTSGTPSVATAGGGGGGGSGLTGGGGGGAGTPGGVAAGGTLGASGTSNGLAGSSAAVNSGCGGGGGGGGQSGISTGGNGGNGGSGWVLIERVS